VPNWTGEPAYKEVAEQLRERIRSGLLTPGEQLPSLADLRHEFDASATVVRMALAELRGEGLVITQQGKGAFVHPHPRTGPPSELAMLRDEVRQLAERVSRLEAQASVQI